MSIGRQLCRTSRVRAWRGALLLLALFATSAQQLVAQTHWHADVAVQADAGAGSSTPDDGAGRHDDCLLCQIAAHAGASAPPAALLQVAIVPELHAAVVAARVHSPPSLRPAHAWQSRGPPAV